MNPASSASALTSPAPRAWVGHWLMAVAVLHTGVAFLLLRKSLLTLVERGVFNSVGQDPAAAAATWFLLFGLLLALLALAITPLERLGDARALTRLGWGVLLLCLLGLLLMPASGFWLALPAAWALIRRGRAG